MECDGQRTWTFSFAQEALMNTNITLSPKHQRLLEALAQGLTQREAAGMAKMHHVTACRVTQRADFKAELKRLREESEQILAQRLPELIRQSLDVLSGEIAFPSERRLRAIRIALDLAASFCAEPVVISSQLSDSGISLTIDHTMVSEPDPASSEFLNADSTGVTDASPS
jgi:hypothetical protein